MKRFSNAKLNGNTLNIYFTFSLFKKKFYTPGMRDLRPQLLQNSYKFKQPQFKKHSNRQVPPRQFECHRARRSRAPRSAL